jgi:DNA polymerase sigma
MRGQGGLIRNRILMVKGKDMQNLSDDQIKRQDFVDNQIYDLVKRLNPSRSEIEWDIEMIGDIRDTIQHWLVDKYKVVDELEFYP